MHRGIVQDPKAAPLVFPGAALKSLLRCEMKEGRKEGGRKEGRKRGRERGREEATTSHPIPTPFEHNTDLKHYTCSNERSQNET